MDLLTEAPSIVSLSINALLLWILKRIAEDRARIMDRIEKLEDETSEIGSINAKLESIEKTVDYVREKLDRVIEMGLKRGTS
jgi:hypothetical protein